MSGSISSGWASMPRTSSSTRCRSASDHRGGALPRAAAGLALRLLDLPGQLTMAGALRFILNDEDVALTDARADATLLDFLRLDKRLRRQQGRLRRGRLRRLHGAGRPDERRRAGLRDGQRLHLASSACCTARMWSRSSTFAADGAAPSGAAGDGRLPRQPVRLLHAGLRDVALWPLAAASRSRASPQIETALQGNLCRCTGYAPIVQGRAGDARATPTRRAIRWSPSATR